ncbi:MAG TPA: DUF5916 domain-containing protein [Gemmatimonadaceae bacterium]|jgi:hypothetical protein|nr:DUF5916 domain-containing protein [Gemmatimonadaceae bacterium]
MSGALIASVLGLGMGLASHSVYNGRAGQLAVEIPRIDARIAIDGTLTDPVWGRAALLNGFSEYKPVDGMPAEDSTEVLVWYSKNAIYFGIRAFEIHGPAHATLANRDQIDGDDNVQLILSPFLHSHQALMFAVNPYGVQEDGTITEGVGTTIGVTGISTGTGPDSTDLSSDFVYESKGQVTSFGYQIEVRVPFRSIKFPAKSPQDWGINILRKIQHSGHSDTWYPTKLAAASYLDQAGTLTGLRNIDAGLVLDLNPVVTESAVGDTARYSVGRPQFGGNIRWGITPNLLLNGTYRPDFAEVESDATQIVNDPRVALQYPEKRPFFLDGLEQFNTPSNLIYTRQIESPLAATKLTGKVGDVSLAYLGAIDQEFGHPVFNVARVREDFSQGSEIGAVFTDKEAGGDFNRLAGVDSRITLGTLYTLNFQAASSVTRDSGVSTAGPLWSGSFTRTGRSLYLEASLKGIDPDFDAASGFISRGNIVRSNLDWRYTFYPKHSFFDTFAIDLNYADTWVYRQFTAFDAPEDRQFHPSLIATLHGGWTILYTLALETFGYDPSLYANYYLGHITAHDTTYTHYVGGPSIANTDHNLLITTPTFAKFDLSLFNLYGHDDNFFEWSPTIVWLTSLTLNYRPTSQLRAQLMYNAQVFWRHDDWSIVGKTLIPRLVVEYQLSRPIFFRLVGQYQAVYQNTLRDDGRTDLPIFLLNPATGTYSRAAAFQNNQLQLQGLFAYQPIPGTVAFVGYGNMFNSVFVKFSYLFRM